MLIGVTIAFSIKAQFSTFGKSPTKKERIIYRSSKNFDGKRFSNSIETEVLTGSFRQMMKDQKKSKHVEKVPLNKIPVVPIDTMLFASVSDSLQFWWLGHSTTLVELDGVRILIDPVFSRRAAPFQWIGPKRFHETPIKANHLPFIDIILISHDHYDHLDHHTVQQFASTQTKWLVPLGIGAHLKKWGIQDTNIIELDWWQKHEHEKLAIYATPARHFGGRGMSDRGKAFWASWSIIGKSAQFYYSGDTGYGPHFKEIGKRFGGFDLAIIQVGAYNVNWAEIHLFPMESILAYNDLNAKYFLPVHWGTFNLAMHRWDEPVEEIEKNITEKGILCNA